MYTCTLACTHVIVSIQLESDVKKWSEESCREGSLVLSVVVVVIAITNSVVVVV